MAAGSGRVLADVISGRRAEIDVSDLGYARYQRGTLRPMGAPQVVPAE
jgi:D-amino-acid dehydrogenase